MPRDHLLPHVTQVKVAHPLMLRAIAAAKKKNSALMPARSPTACVAIFCRNATWHQTQIRDRRRTLRYRHLLVLQMVQIKNRTSGLLMETGVSHNKKRLHKVGYFRELLSAEPVAWTDLDWLRKRAGGTVNSRLNARLKAASDS